MSQGYALSKYTVSGYLVSVSGKQLTSIKVPAKLWFTPEYIDVSSTFEDNYRPRIVMDGSVSSMEGAFASGIDSVTLDESMPAIVEYALSDQEIAQLAIKGFFRERYPIHEAAFSAFSIPHQVSCLVFDEAEVPVIVVDFQSCEIVCDNTDIGRDLAKDFPTYTGGTPVKEERFNELDWIVALEPEVVPDSAPIGEDIQTDNEEVKIEEEVEEVNREINEVLKETLAEMIQPPKTLEWEESEVFQTEDEKADTLAPNKEDSNAPELPAGLEYKNEEAMSDFGE